MVQVFLGPRNSDNFYQLKVDVDSGDVVQKEKLTGSHPHVDATDMQMTEKACLADPAVQSAINDLQLPEGAIIKIEPWTYATDGVNDMKQKITMVGNVSPRWLLGRLICDSVTFTCDSSATPTRTIMLTRWTCA